MLPELSPTTISFVLHFSNSLTIASTTLGSVVAPFSGGKAPIKLGFTKTTFPNILLCSWL